MEQILHQELKKRHYNTVGNFLSFYSDFLRSRKHAFSFGSFFKSYQPKIIPKSLSCVGLSFALVDRLMTSDPDLRHYLFYASCEEWTDKTEEECDGPPEDGSCKEHVMVALRIRVNNDREGVVLFDPGYHVAKPIVLMADEKYPHTGWLLVSDTPKCRKEYHYSLTKNGNYVHWVTREVRNGIETVWHSFIYVGQKFLSPVEVVEKKNLVYNFRTLVVRDEKGPKAGFYCNLNGQQPQFTLFYPDDDIDGLRGDCKIPFNYFKSETNAICKAYEIAIEKCAKQIGYNFAFFKSMLKTVVGAFYDPSFMPHLLRVNNILEGEEGEMAN